MMNVKTILSNPICNNIGKCINEELPVKILNKAQDTQNEPQKIYAKDLSVLGYNIRKNFLPQDKAKLDELANNFISKFFTKLPKENATQYVLNAINKKNYKFVEALSIDMRTYYDKMEELKKNVGSDDYELKILPAFKNAYREYIDKLCKDENVSLEYLLTLRPDWSFYKIMNKMDFSKTRVFGELPRGFISEQDSNILFKELEKIAQCPKDKTKKTFDFKINNNTYKITEFTDGCVKSGAFLVEANGEKYVCKITPIAYYDPEIISIPHLKTFPSRDLFVDYYLTKNNCKDCAKLYYYKYDVENKKNFTIYEYIDGEVKDLQTTTFDLADMKNLKIHFTDTRSNSNIIFKDNKPICVDTDKSLQFFPSDLLSFFHHWRMDYLPPHL